MRSLCLTNLNELARLSLTYSERGTAEAKENLILALENQLRRLAVDYLGRDNNELTSIRETIKQWQDRLRTATRGVSIELTPARKKVYLDCVDSLDAKLTAAGAAEAMRIFDLPETELKFVAIKVYQRDQITSYLHRIYVRQADYNAIAHRLEEDPTANVIRTILKETNRTLHYQKSHQFIPTVAGDDLLAMGLHYGAPCMLHAQISYAEDDGGTLIPIELLITKYSRPINVLGFPVR